MLSLNLCPLDDDPPRRIRQMPMQVQQINNKQVSHENTECNYLVMFFILGVFMLVVSDQIK